MPDFKTMICLKVQKKKKKDFSDYYVIFTSMHLADAFIQRLHSGVTELTDPRVAPVLLWPCETQAESSLSALTHRNGSLRPRQSSRFDVNERWKPALLKTQSRSHPVEFNLIFLRPVKPDLRLCLYNLIEWALVLISIQRDEAGYMRSSPSVHNYHVRTPGHMCVSPLKIMWE